MKKTDATQSKPAKDFWQHPWGWRHALVIQLAVVALAFPLQWRLAHAHLGMTPPWNWLLPGLFILLGIALGLVCRRQQWMRWLSGAQYAVTIIIIVAVISLVGTLIPQDAGKTDALTRLGLRTLYTSLPFVASILLMMFSLATVVGRRLATPRPGYLGFMLNHLGLLLVLLGMLAGKAQFANPLIELTEGASSSTAQDETGRLYDIGAQITLHKFEMESFPPKLVVEYLDAHDKTQTASDQDWVCTGRHFSAAGVTVQVEKYLPLAMPDHNAMNSKDMMSSINSIPWVASNHGVPAAKIQVTMPDGTTKDGWVTAKTARMNAIPLMPDEQHLVGLQDPSPKAFRSHITITVPGKQPADAVLAVNQPVRVGGWQLYQSSYDMGMGMSSSSTSIIQAVHDPALPVVYTGLACLVLGAFLAMWLTPKRRETPADADTTEAQS